MARPKYTENSITAKERIKNAFWTLLADNDYEKISIKMLAAEAGVNHNSLYYYYDNINAIAKSAFDNTVIKQLGLLTHFASVSNIDALKKFIQSQPEIATRYQRIKLFASANSIYLQHLLKDGLLDTWLSQSGKSKEDLSSLDLLELEFMFSAIVALLGRKNDPDDLEQFIQGSLGQSLISTLKRILS